MTHRLVPRVGHLYLNPREVVSRLLSEFPYVASSEEAGRRYVRGIIQRLCTLKETGEVPIDYEYLHRLEKVQDRAIYVYFEDWNSETAFLSTAVIPGEPLFFYYSSREHEQAATALLIRCARKLDYDIVAI